MDFIKLFTAPCEKSFLAGCYTLPVFLLLCGCQCSVFLPLGAMGWSIICDNYIVALVFWGAILDT